VIEPLIEFDATLRMDPAGAYSRMDFDSREQYREQISFLARYSDSTESEVAQAALHLAEECAAASRDDSRKQFRQTHIGYYLVDCGVTRLKARIGFHGRLRDRARSFLLSNAEDFFISGIHFVAILIICAVLFPLLPHTPSLFALMFSALLLWIPAMQVGVELMNYAISVIFPPRPLPKLDFSKGIPAGCATLVAVPSLLLGEEQVRELAGNLEIRFLANRDPHLHFALLTDLPDSISKPHDRESSPLLDLAIGLIHELNHKYGSADDGPFLLLHRRRVFSTRQGVWMGWERKRGKLLDLNQLLTGEFDAFPVKAGNLAVLGTIRYVITLDADTQLPRGTAARLVSAIAHPLNQAVVDPTSRIVTAGYGILQPRIGITARSAARSRLAAIYSGQNGFDIYTRAVSDPYQDLFGEGIFTGKGIYEVRILHDVLNRRFPHNALLSHDLIEGAYARAGLAQDIELIDDYPSHYSAYSRRKHRWVRGDWQIAQWMFSRVPSESGHQVKNPISSVSRWKIFDNLRRSLVDPFLFILFVAGWLVLPGGPLYWTLVPLVLVCTPSAIQLLIGLIRAITDWRNVSVADLMAGFSRTLFLTFSNLIFLLHQTLLAVDAIVRAIVRRFITGERLLEWETAEQTEVSGTSNTPVDRYLAFMPFVCIGLAFVVWIYAPRPRGILIAAPILLLWSLATVVILWINRPVSESKPLSLSEQDRLMGYALHTWRYFRDFGGSNHNYLIPDHVEEETCYEAARVSPTNIGLALNARLAAVEMGFLTLPEFATLTTESLATISRLSKFRGHLFNWYDTRSLQYLDASPMVSSVDSGNFVASLITLTAGVHELLHKPLFPPQLFQCIRFHCRQMRAEWSIATTLHRHTLPTQSAAVSEWIQWLCLTDAALRDATCQASLGAEELQWSTEIHERVAGILALVRDYCPWLLPDYAALVTGIGKAHNPDATLSISYLTSYASELRQGLDRYVIEHTDDPQARDTAEHFYQTLAAAVNNLCKLELSLRSIAHEAERVTDETDFSFLVSPDRQILSVGYDVGARSLNKACYDMIASEARIATFLAIARGDLPQQGWSRLSREHTRAYGRFILLSWTGTMFEYLMPALWMRSYSNTLIMRTQVACVRAQRMFADALNIPWGISESGFAQKDDANHYHYRAFGIPAIALSDEANAGPVISPYSTFLALAVDIQAALANLQRMASVGWFAHYGFYEAMDYSHSVAEPELVREWMAHHQGMALLAMTNALHKNVFQRWFHTSPIVRSAELLLHEAPMSTATLNSWMRDVA